MTTLSRRYPSLDAALDALAAALPLAVSPATDEHPRGVVACGLSAGGGRWDVQIAPVIAPTGRLAPAPFPGAEVEEIAPTGEVDLDLHWQGDAPPALAGAPREAPSTAFEQPVPDRPPLADAKAAARARVVAYADTITARITARYPVVEVASWPTQEAEARAITAGSTDAPLLTALALRWDMTLDHMADVVLAKAAGYRAVVAAVIEVRDATMTALDAAQDYAALDAALAAARIRADGLARQLGL